MMDDLTGTVREIRVTQISDSRWRWLVCAVEPSGVIPPHRATWGGVATTPTRAFEEGLRQFNEIAAFFSATEGAS